MKGAPTRTRWPRKFQKRLEIWGDSMSAQSVPLENQVYDWRAKKRGSIKWPPIRGMWMGSTFNLIHVRSIAAMHVPLAPPTWVARIACRVLELIEPSVRPVFVEPARRRSDLVIPLDAGSGFSGIQRLWLGRRPHARTFIKMMREHLAYSRFGCQCGMGHYRRHTDMLRFRSVLGLHINLPVR